MNNPPELLFSVLTKDFQSLHAGLKGNEVTLFSALGSIDASKQDPRFIEEVEISDLDDQILISIRGKVREVKEKDGALFALIPTRLEELDFCWVVLNAATLVTIH